MKAQIFRGTKQEIAEGIARIEGDVREAIVLIEEPVALPPVPATMEEMFAEMEPYMAKGPSADYSREAIYSRFEGE